MFQITNICFFISHSWVGLFNFVIAKFDSNKFLFVAILLVPSANRVVPLAIPVSLYNPLLFTDSSEPAESADNIHVNDPTSVAISGSHGQLTPLSGSHYGGQLTPLSGSHYDCQLTPTAEPIHPDGARRWRGIDEHRKDASRSRFIKPLPQDPLEHSGKRSTRPYNAGRTESRGVNVDPSMLATGRYVGYDPVDTSI